MSSMDRREAIRFYINNVVLYLLDEVPCRNAMVLVELGDKDYLIVSSFKIKETREALLEVAFKLVEEEEEKHD